MELKAGTFLQGEKYKIVKTLGKGGFGITYLAEQALMDRLVCIKEFYIDDQCDRDSDTCQVRAVSTSAGAKFQAFMLKFIKEAKTIARLDHPNIIRIYDVFPENGTAYYVMEYIDGQTLESYANEKGRLSEEEAIGFVRQAATALDYIHKNRITHLDVKPANLMLKKNGRLVLIDFGVSKHYDEEGHQTTTTPIGISRGYAPLEQYLAGGVGEFSPESDVYSLGATLYRLLTGSAPTEAPMLKSEGIQFPDYVSENTAIAIVRAMQPDRKERPASASAFMDILEGRSTTVIPNASEAAAAATAPAVSQPAGKPAAAATTTVAAPTPTATAPATAPAAAVPGKKNKLGLILGIAGGVLAAAVALILLLGRKPATPDNPPAPPEPPVVVVQVPDDSTAVAQAQEAAAADQAAALAAEKAAAEKLAAEKAAAEKAAAEKAAAERAAAEKAAAEKLAAEKAAAAKAAASGSAADKKAAEKAAAERAAAEKAAAEKAAAEKAAAEKAAAEKAAAEKAAAEKAAAEKAAAEKAAAAKKAAAEKAAAEKAAADKAAADKKAAEKAAAEKAAAEKAASEKAAAEKAAAEKAATEKAAAEKAAAAKKAAAEKAAAEKAAADKAAADKKAAEKAAAEKAAARVIYGENGLFGFKDGNGTVVIPATYANVWKYGSDGFAKVKASNNKVGLIDRSGKLVVPTKYNDVFPFSEGLARVYSNGRYGFVDTSGNEVIAPAYKDAYNFAGGYALVAKGSKWGFVDKSGTEKNFNYDYMSEIPGRVYLLRKGGLFGFCDQTGREVSKFIYTECKGYETKAGGKYMYLMSDQHGEEIEVYEADLLR